MSGLLGNKEQVDQEAIQALGGLGGSTTVNRASTTVAQTPNDGSSLKKFGTVAQGFGLGLETLSILGASSANRDMIRSNAKLQERSLATQQRARFGSMLAQSGETGLTQSSFIDIFNNQTLEDARQMIQLKQQKLNAIAADKNAKRRAITSAVVATLGQATRGLSGGA